MKIREHGRRAAYLRQYPVRQYFGQDMDSDLEVHVFRKGEAVCAERKTPQYLFFLMAGRVKLSVMHQDGNITLAQYFEPVSVLGELEFLGIRKESQLIQAVEDTVCIALPFATCRERLLADAVFLQNLSRFLAEKMLQGVNKLVATQRYPLEYRLARYLLRTEGERQMDRRPRSAERQTGPRSVDGADEWIQVRMTELAQYLGVSYRHLSRVMHEFVQAGWIQKERNRLRITDRRQLAERVAQMKAE